MVSTWSNPSARLKRWSRVRAAIPSLSRRGKVFTTCTAWLAAALPIMTCGLDLADHPSPYLRDHASDPVRWMAPENEPLVKARQNRLPVLVSSGYLSCYWCYRLKQDTFNSPRLAVLANRDYVPVMIDREMHGVDDRLLQAFMQRTRGFGGWPVVAILTPDGDPIQAWPFISANDLTGALERFSATWQDNGRVITAEVKEVNRSASLADQPASDLTAEISTLLSAFLRQTGDASDTEFGGFGKAEKYPYLPQLQAMLDLHQLNPSEAIAGFTRSTIQQMLAGDLLDPVEGGVFRYTENRDWTAPHFEQMLYTQALASRLLLRAANALGERGFAEAAGRILDNMITHYSTDSGLMVAALSAVGEDGINGSYYLPSKRDLVISLGDNWASRITIRQQVEDRILARPVGPLSEVTRQALLGLRQKSDRPRDDKLLLSWNGLALSALSHGLALDARFSEPASKLANALKALSENTTLPLLATFPSGPEADLAGYVYTATGLFDWWQISGDAAAISRVADLLERAADRYHDGNGWRQGRALVLADPASLAMLPDNQLPSPSAEWLRLADALAGAGFDIPGQVAEVSRKMVSGWPQALEEEAFFHATLASTLVTRRLLGIH